MRFDIHRILSKGIPLWALTMLTSCAVGPNYSAPDLSVPEAFVQEWEEKPATISVADSPVLWWEILGDEILTELIGTAIEANLDIQIATARLRESRAGRSAARADFLPAVGADGTAAVQRQSENSPFYGGGDRETDFYQLGFDASWEIDVFGGVRRSVEAAGARESAAQAGLKDVTRTVMAEVALNYVQLRGLQKRKIVLLNNIDVQEQTLNFTRNKLISGLGTELEVSQTSAQLLSIKSALPELESGIRLRIYQISILLGEQPEQRYDQLITYRPLPQIPAEVFTDTPSDVLRQRPDIQQAEYVLNAEVADIGVATADLFPRFALFGDVGGVSTATENLFDGASRFWSIGPSFRWSIFQGGKIRAGIEAQEAQAQAALAQYEKTVLEVLREVNSALVEHGYERQKAQSLRAARRQSQNSVELSTTLYQKGLSDILTVLNTELLLLRVEDEYASSLTREWTSLIRLYKAMGGGWPQRSAG